MKMIELNQVSIPITANMAGMVALFGVCKATIRALTAKGVIRRAKLGDASQSTSVYFVQDMVDYLASQTQNQNHKGTPQ